jgi:NAD(P)-dependent dehydrogenase (short-subunit alcohol dehydrogenase family)
MKSREAHIMQTILITGANRGIGLGHARAFAERGAKVYATARALGDAGDLHALAAAHPGRVELLPYDAADPGGADALKAALAGAPLDLLFANAGTIGEHQQFGAINPDSVLETIRTNAIAPLSLAQALAANVAASERKLMAFQSSLMGSLADNGSGGYYAYRCSKAALSMVARGLAQDLRADGVISVALHPGWVRSDMGGPSAKLSVADCVAAQQRLLMGLKPSDSGKFFNYDGKELPW